MVRQIVVIAGVVLAPMMARADITTKAGDATIDWTRGMIVATGVGLGDRHAPAPAVARAASRRRADDASRRELAAAVKQIAWRAGAGDPAALAADAAWIASRSVVVDATLEPDGSWRVTSGLPIEAIRTRLGKPRTLAEDGDAAKAPTAIVIDVKQATVVPVGGVALAGKRGEVVGPTLWFDRDPPADVVGARPVKLAGKLAKGTITVAGDLPDDAGSALIVVVVRRP